MNKEFKTFVNTYLTMASDPGEMPPVIGLVDSNNHLALLDENTAQQLIDDKLVREGVHFAINKMKEEENKDIIEVFVICEVYKTTIPKEAGPVTTMEQLKELQKEYPREEGISVVHESKDTFTKILYSLEYSTDSDFRIVVDRNDPEKNIIDKHSEEWKEQKDKYNLINLLP